MSRKKSSTSPRATLTMARPQRGPGPQGISLEEVRAHLARMPREELLDLLNEELAQSDALLERLRLQVARTAAGGRRLATFRAALENAIEVDHFVEYGESFDYFDRVERTIGEIRPLMADDPRGVAELAQYAIGALEEAVNSAIDDSGGHSEGVLADLVALHLAACRRAKWPPEMLGPGLLALELGSSYAEFDVVDRYAKVLGSRGLAAYRAEAEARWAAVPALGPGDERLSYDAGRVRITQVMEGLARRAGDLEALVSVRSRDLSSPYRFFEMARLYRDAGDHDRALEWAERGTAALPADPDWRLQELLADEYHRRSRHADAMALAWRNFAGRPYLDSYRDLKRHAQLAGDWPAWRDRALSHLGHGAGSERRPGLDRSTLVDILLWEGDVEDAWREAVAGGCDDVLWMRLAAEREAGHPGDVIPVYRRLAERAVNRKDNQSYAEAVGLMRKVREAMERLGDQAGFRAYVEQVRAANRPKRNFMTLLDSERW